jgi:hypothetical protein
VDDAALRFDEDTPDESPTGRVAVRHAGRLVAELRSEQHPSGLLWLSAVLDPTAFDRATTRELLARIIDLSHARGARDLELDTDDPLLRDAARQSGMAGSLRGPLTIALDAVRPVAPGTGGATLDGAGLDAAGLGTAISQLVPDAGVVGRAVRNPLRAGIRRALFGLPAMVDLLVDPRDGGERVRFVVPRRDDLLVESVARCVDTVVGIRRRFGPDVPPVLTVSFDYSDMGLRTGVISGSAATQVGVIHMNADHCLAEGVERARRRAAKRGGGVSATVPPPFSAVDATTAHEMWHQIEGDFEAAHYRDSIEFRRRIGEYLGVETLEHATLGGNRHAPPAWQAAFRRLVQEVSAYAATSPREATAEMFKLWWCSSGRATGVVARFGDLVDGLFPARV